MGIFRKGILGGFRKKVGTVIGSSWRGLDVMRGLPKISDKPATQEQLDQRFKFGLVTGLLAWVSDVIDIGYRSAAQVPTPMNVAVSDNLKLAVTGVSPNFSIDPLALRFSKGKLSLPSDYSVAMAADAVLDYAWSKDTENRFNHLTDAVHLVVYNPEKQKFAQVLNAGTREDEEYSMQLPLDWTGDVVHSYLCLSAPKQFGNACSDTQYVGQSTVL
jgi:hypothetical protein